MSEIRSNDYEQMECHGCGSFGDIRYGVKFRDGYAAVLCRTCKDKHLYRQGIVSERILDRKRSIVEQRPI